MEIVQEFVSVYELWNKLEVLSASGLGSSNVNKMGSNITGTGVAAAKAKMGTDEMIVGILTRMRFDRSRELELSKKNGNGWK